MKNIFISTVLFLCMFSFLNIQYSYGNSDSDIFNEIFGGDNTSKKGDSKIYIIKKPIGVSDETIKSIDMIFEKVKVKLEPFNIDKKLEVYNNVNKKINSLIISKTTKVNKDTLGYLRDLIKQEIENIKNEKGLLKDLFGDIKSDSICNKGYSYTDGSCIKTETKTSSNENMNKKVCWENNGYGNQFWYETYWSHCYITSCNEGYYLSNGTCISNYNPCYSNQHLENNYCVSNTRNCSVNNGYGTQNWYSNYWSSCSVNSCYSGYYLSNGTCVGNYNYCSTDQHLENNSCVSNTRNCSVNYGFGTQNWYSNYWGDCYNISCYSGYYLSNGSCVSNYNNCSQNEHLENNYCVSNTKSCSVNNGYGTQNWYSNYWSSCSVNSCYSGYYLSNGSCFRY